MRLNIKMKPIMANHPLSQFILAGLLLMVLMPSALAHRYFVGLTEISVNQRNQHTEIIHQFTAHDIEAAIALEQNIKFDIGHSQYEQKIQQYFAKNFKIQFKNQKIALSWIGLELVGDQLVIYQEADQLSDFQAVSIVNQVLLQAFDKQVNTLNYNDGKHHGSLVFTQQKQYAEIKN